MLDFRKCLTDEDELFGKPIVISGDEKRFDSLKDHMGSYGIQINKFPAVMLKSLPATEHFDHVSVGINLSHAAVLRSCIIKNYNKPYVFVLEDDCRFFEDPRHHMIPALSNVLRADPNFAVISLGCYRYDRQGVAPPLSKGESFLMNSISGWYPWGSHAWIYNINRAAELIGWLSSMWRPLDHIMTDPQWNKNCWLMRPAIAYQESLKEEADVIKEHIKQYAITTPLWVA